MAARTLEDGLVHIPSAIDEPTQRMLAEVVRIAGGSGAAPRQPGTINGGFFTSDGQLNQSPSWGRGRIYAALDRFPRAAELRVMCLRLVARARRADPAMPDMNPTHLLLNHYCKGCGIPTHIDNAENDGESDHPVVSVSLGNTCNFEMMHSGSSWCQGYVTDDPPGPCHRVTLKHSDALLFGGPARMMKHTIVGRTLPGGRSVRAITTGSAPPDLDLGPEFRKGDGLRISFTFRHVPDLVGQEYKHVTFHKRSTQRGAPRTKPRWANPAVSAPVVTAGEKNQVERLIRRRQSDGRYLVKWKGYSDTTWEPLENIGSWWIARFEKKLAHKAKPITLSRRKQQQVELEERGKATDSLVGTSFTRLFNGKPYQGIVMCRVASGDQYRVEYEDGDVEMLSKDDLKRAEMEVKAAEVEAAAMEAVQVARKGGDSHQSSQVLTLLGRHTMTSQMAASVGDGNSSNSCGAVAGARTQPSAQKPKRTQPGSQKQNQLPPQQQRRQKRQATIEAPALATVKKRRKGAPELCTTTTSGGGKCHTNTGGCRSVRLVVVSVEQVEEDPELLLGLGS